MSRGLDTDWPVAAFCDLEQDAWGVLLGGPEPQLALGTFSQPDVGFEPVAVDGLSGDGEWLVTAANGTFRLSAAITGTAEAHDADADQVALCRASGTFTLHGREHRLDAGALRCPQLPGGRSQSIRLTGAWFAAGHAVALLADRPRGAAGQDHDRIGVAVLGEEGNVTAFDPRLSTTYRADGAVSRMGIELWLGETEEAEHYPRRVAGERAGAGLDAQVAEVRVEALPLRCHGRSDEGAGVYLLLRRT